MGKKKYSKKEKEILNLIINNKQEAFDKLLIIIKNNEIISKDIINNFLINLLEKSDDNLMIKIYNEIKDTIYISDLITKTLLIRYFVKKEILIAENLLENIDINKLKKRTIIPIYNYYCDNNNMRGLYFYKKYLLNKFKLEMEDYHKLIKLLINNNNDSELENIYQNMSDNFIEIDFKIVIELIKKFNDKKYKLVEIQEDGYCNNCKKHLISFDIIEKERLVLLKNLEEIYINESNNKFFKEYEKYLIKNNIDVFLDGGNIAFFKDRKISINSFVRINSITKKLLEEGKKILIVLHRRHVDYLKKNFKNNDLINIKKIISFWKENKILYLTPYKMNDDWFFIYGSLFKKIITNNK